MQTMQGFKDSIGLYSRWLYDMEVSKQWYEELPDACPPADASLPNSLTYYRMCESFPAADKDFLSHRELSPTQVFKAPECIARAVSMYRDYDECAQLLSLAVHQHKVVLQVTLSADSGLVKKTGKAKSHFSWWRLKNFDPAPIATVAEVIQ